MKFFRFGLIFKFAVTISLLIFITSLLLTFFLVFSERIRVVGDLKDKGYSTAKNLSYASEQAVLSKDTIYLKNLLNSLKDEKDLIYAQIFDSKGELLAQTFKPKTAQTSVFNVDSPIESIERRSRDETLRKILNIKPYNITVIGEVKVGVSLSKVDNTVSQIFQVIFGITLGVVLFGIVGVFVLTRWFLKNPIEQIVTGTKKISEGDLDYKIKIKSQDEIGALAESFNLMTSDLKKSKVQIEAHTQILEERVKERTKELEEALSKLQGVDRMKTEFLSVVSHELKTPLTPILEYTSLLDEKVLGPLNEKQEQAIGTIKRQGSHLNNLIDTVIDVSKLELGRSFATKKEFVSMEKVMKDIEEALHIDLNNKELTFIQNIPSNIPTLYADGSAIKRLILNLIGNSIKFTPRGGKITISALEEGKTIKFCVSDSGIGIAKENLEKIFDKFYQVDSSYTREAGGIGMGLPIAKGIVEAHHGKIWAESLGLGHGTTICFQIPLMQE